MSNELATIRTAAITPTTAEEAYSFAARAYKSGLLSPEIKSVEAAFTILATGVELGLQPMQALRGIHVIKGRPVLGADTIVALVKRSSECVYFRVVKSTDEEAVFETLRKGEPEPTRHTFTKAMAKRAGLSGGNWDRYPDAMLRHRCAAALARMVYPDVVLGIYEESEGEEIAQAPRVVQVAPRVTEPEPVAVEEAEVVPAPGAVSIEILSPAEALEGRLRRAMGEAKTLAEIEALAPEVKAALAERKIDDAAASRLRKRYSHCKGEIILRLQREAEGAPQREPGED